VPDNARPDQQQVAEMIGVIYQHGQRYESGIKIISADRLYVIAQPSEGESRVKPCT
jgi:transcriptional regulator with XRE-family HTH domain